MGSPDKGRRPRRRIDCDRHNRVASGDDVVEQQHLFGDLFEVWSEVECTPDFDPLLSLVPEMNERVHRLARDKRTAINHESKLHGTLMTSVHYA